MWRGTITNREQLLQKWPKAILFFIPGLPVPPGFEDGRVYPARITCKLANAEVEATEVSVRPADRHMQTPGQGRTFSAVAFGDLAPEDLWSFDCIVHDIAATPLETSEQMAAFYALKAR